MIISYKDLIKKWKDKPQKEEDVEKLKWWRTQDIIRGTYSE